MPLIEIMEDLFFIERGFLNGNHFVYRHEEPILIDTAYITDFARTEELITSLGVDLTRTRLIISTHCHCDHIGGNRIVQQRSDCHIALHKIGKHFIDTRNDWATWWRYFAQEAQFFHGTTALEDGDTLCVGPHEFMVLHTPGHASDGIVLYNRNEKVLLSSDTLWETDMAAITERVEGNGACFWMLQSLDRLADLDVEIVYPGHGRPFRNVAEAIERSRGRLNGFLSDRRKIGTDLLKKIVVYTLLMRRSMDEATFPDYLMQTHWFPETVDLYFDGEYGAKYHEIMKEFLNRGIVQGHNGSLTTTVKP